jgi:hypothetical protein
VSWPILLVDAVEKLGIALPADVIASAAIAGVIANDVSAAYTWPSDVVIGKVLYSLIGESFASYKELQAPEDVLNSAGAIDTISHYPAAAKLMNSIIVIGDYASTPGPKSFKAGGVMFGYLGHTTANEFINGLDLASDIGLSAGTAQHSDDGWLKWMKRGKLMYVARKPLRYSIAWDHIHAVGAVFGTKTISIQGRTYRVRLLSGGDGQPATGAGGEWNEIMYGVHQSTEPDWESYSDDDVVVGSSGNGRLNWCQETPASDVTHRIYRGGPDGISNLGTSLQTSTSTAYGWRPVLELVS